ncbi:MAG: CYTH domain-containing protein, partial [Bacteroidota bacterium]
RSFEKEATEIIPISQGYICNEQDKNVRIRVAGDHAFITIKGKASGFSRPEFEYPVPVEDAYEIIDLLCDVTIQKKRYLVHYDNNTWEVDVFEGENEGLILAEIELPDEKFTFKKPDWLGWEVTGNPDYYNAMLIKKPYKRWNKKG